MPVTALFVLFALLFTGPAGNAAAEAIVADHSTVALFESIPDSVFGEIRDSFKIFYGHTSHGSQIVSGLDMLADEETTYAKPVFYQISADLGHNGDLSWVQPTRDFLDSHPDYNMAVWSWCGGVSDNTEAGIDIYLNALSGLEAEYPGVAFVYMTGHLDGTGPSGNLYVRNDQIRAYCLQQEKMLFDFADIESYDPDGVWYPWESDACGWCADWCSTHECPGCPYCAHSHCFNCYRKGKSFWWLLARLAGWSESVVVAGPEGQAPAPLFSLGVNRPNPFNPVTEILFSLNERAEVRLEIFDLAGRIVSTPVQRDMAAGDHRVIWNATGADGRRLAGGSYFVRLRAGGVTETRKMILLH